MVPVSFKKVIGKVSGSYADIFNHILSKQCAETELGQQIRQCSLETLERSLNDILNVVPTQMADQLESLVSFHVRRDPLTHELRICPMFSPEGILTTLKNQGAIKSSRLAIIDENDKFQFNGARQPVEHTLAQSCSDKVAGAYVELTMADSNVTVWTISPEELMEARNLWTQRYLGEKDYEYLNELIILLRAMKTLQSTILFGHDEALGELLGNIVAYYNTVFSNYDKERKQRFASSVDQRSRFISDQESEIEKLMGDLGDEDNLAYGKRISQYETSEKQTSEGQVISIGTSGW